MANFRPLKQHMLSCLDRFIAEYALHGPFLEVGCGTGEVSAHLAARGWRGTAIDFSESAIAQATTRLIPHPEVAVRRQALESVEGRYACVLMWDVLEHIEDDVAALRRVSALLEPGGHLLLAVPSNPREWRWDDEFYGHWRRYTEPELSAKLADAGLQAQVFWDFTYPLYWALRRGYTGMKSPPPGAGDKFAATQRSATVNAWEIPLLSRLLDASALLWKPLNAMQHRFFRHQTARGHEFFALAQKPLAASEVEA